MSCPATAINTDCESVDMSNNNSIIDTSFIDTIKVTNICSSTNESTADAFLCLLVAKDPLLLLLLPWLATDLD